MTLTEGEEKEEEKASGKWWTIKKEKEEEYCLPLMQQHDTHCIPMHESALL